MPYTTYGLFTAMRSHRIDNPSAAVSVRSGRPNACNLCHLDQTLAWTAEYLTKWYGRPAVETDLDGRIVAASLIGLLRGDAAQRAIAAWSMGWEPARRVSGERWLAPYLAPLLDDPYAAVRRVSYLALRKLPGFSDFSYDFVTGKPEREAAVQRALEIWRRMPYTESTPARGPILMGRNGAPDRTAVDRLVRQRDNRPVRIIE
jgi:hypothetical protein